MPTSQQDYQIITLENFRLPLFTQNLIGDPRDHCMFLQNVTLTMSLDISITRFRASHKRRLAAGSVIEDVFAIPV